MKGVDRGSLVGLAGRYWENPKLSYLSLVSWESRQVVYEDLGVAPTLGAFLRRVEGSLACVEDMFTRFALYYEGVDGGLVVRNSSAEGALSWGLMLKGGLVEDKRSGEFFSVHSLSFGASRQASLPEVESGRCDSLSSKLVGIKAWPTVAEVQAKLDGEVPVGSVYVVTERGGGLFSQGAVYVVDDKFLGCVDAAGFMEWAVVHAPEMRFVEPSGVAVESAVDGAGAWLTVTEGPADSDGRVGVVVELGSQSALNPVEVAAVLAAVMAPSAVYPSHVRSLELHGGGNMVGGVVEVGLDPGELAQAFTLILGVCGWFHGDGFQSAESGTVFKPGWAGTALTSLSATPGCGVVWNPVGLGRSKAVLGLEQVSSLLAGLRVLAGGHEVLGTLVSCLVGPGGTAVVVQHGGVLRAVRDGFSGPAVHGVGGVWFCELHEWDRGGIRLCEAALVEDEFDRPPDGALLLAANGKWRGILEERFSVQVASGLLSVEEVGLEVESVVDEVWLYGFHELRSDPREEGISRKAVARHGKRLVCVVSGSTSMVSDWVTSENVESKLGPRVCVRDLRADDFFTCEDFHRVRAEKVRRGLTGAVRDGALAVSRRRLTQRPY